MKGIRWQYFSLFAVVDEKKGWNDSDWKRNPQQKAEGN